MHLRWHSRNTGNLTICTQQHAGSKVALNQNSNKPCRDYIARANLMLSLYIYIKFILLPFGYLIMLSLSAKPLSKHYCIIIYSELQSFQKIGAEIRAWYWHILEENYRRLKRFWSDPCPTSNREGALYCASNNCLQSQADKHHYHQTRKRPPPSSRPVMNSKS